LNRDLFHGLVGLRIKEKVNILGFRWFDFGLRVDKKIKPKLTIPGCLEG